MAGHPGDRERGLAGGQGERHDELIGEIRIDGAARGEKLEQLVHGFVGHALGRLAPLSEREEAGPGVLELRPQEQERSRRAGAEAHDLQLEHRRQISEPARGLVPLPLPDAWIEPGDGGDPSDGSERPALHDADRMEAPNRPDRGVNNPASGRIEARSRHLEVRVEADLLQVGQPLEVHVVETGTPAHVCAAAQIHAGRRRSKAQRRQDRLQYQRRRSGGSDVERKFARGDRSGLEEQRWGTERGALDPRSGK